MVDANHVFALPGATWGNVARFPGALRSRGTHRNRPLQAIRDAQERGKPHAMRAKTRLTGAARRWHATPTRPTILNLDIVTACVMAITDFAFLMLNTCRRARAPLSQVSEFHWEARL